MKPYYEDDQVTLYHGDCLERPDLWTCADVLVTDPPYGINYRSNARRSETLGLARSILGDADTSARDAALEVWIKTDYFAEWDGPALVFGTWRIRRPAETRQVLIWDTLGANGMGATDLPWKPAHQEIYVIGSGFHGHRGNDVIRAAPVQSTATNGRLHPHQKPVELLKVLIDKCPKGSIADPFAGSGSTLVAAKALGRKAIGFELEERYCEIAANRLRQDVLDFTGGAA